MWHQASQLARSLEDVTGGADGTWFTFYIAFSSTDCRAFSVGTVPSASLWDPHASLASRWQPRFATQRVASPPGLFPERQDCSVNRPSVPPPQELGLHFHINHPGLLLRTSPGTYCHRLPVTPGWPPESRPHSPTSSACFSWVPCFFSV